MILIIVITPSFFVYREGVREFSISGPFFAMQDIITEVSSDDFFVVMFGKTPRNLLTYIPGYFSASCFHLAAGTAASLLLGLMLGLSFGLNESKLNQKIIAFISAIPDFILVIILQIASILLYQRFTIRLGKLNYAMSHGILFLPFMTILIVSLSFTVRTATRFTIEIRGEGFIRYALAKGLHGEKLS